MTTICKGSTLLAILFAAAACGSVNMEESTNPLGPDAGAEPGDPDASETLPLIGPCSVTTGVFGLAVDLHQPDGAVLASTTTSGTAGIASFEECPRDAMISLAAFDEKLASWRGVTIASVQPGSAFDLRLSGIGWQGTLVAQVPDDAAALEFPRLYAGSRCLADTEQGASQEVAITADCIGDVASALPVLGTARIDGVRVYTHTKVDATFNTNGVTNVAAADMTNWVTGGDVALSVINVPTASVQFKMEWMRNGVGYGSSGWGAAVQGNVASRDIPVPPTSFSTKRRVGVHSNGPTREGYILLSDQPAVEFDFAHALGSIEDVVLDATDSTRPSFTMSGVDADADLAVIQLRWTTKGLQEVVWRVLVPSQATSQVTFPALSDAFAEILPNPGLELQEMYVIDMSGSDYEGILSSGYRIGSTNMNCGEVTETSECRFAYIKPQPLEF